MPKFNHAGLIRADNLSLQKVDLPEITLGGKAVGYDYHKDMEAMFQEAKDQKEKRERNTRSLILGDLDLGAVSLAISSFDVGGTWKGLSILSESEQLLEDAKKLVAQGQFQQALPLLEQVLRVEADQEAIYLKAYCLVELNRPEDALVCVASLRHANLPPMLQARIEALRERIRKAISEVLFTELFLQEMLGRMLGDGSSQTRQVIARLQRLVDLDPEMGMYHFMLGARLLETGQLEQALDVANRGVREATTGDCTQLEAFQRHVESIYLRKLVQPAVHCFKRHEYQPARLALKQINPIYHKDQRVLVLDAYFQEVERQPPKRGADLQPPKGSSGVVQELYQFLVGEEMDQAQRCMGQGQIDEAEILLRQARQYAPAFVPANLALAGCVYMRGRIEYMISMGSLDKGDLLRRLQEIRPYASLAASVEEEGRKLVDALEHFVNRLEEEQQVDRVIQEFVSIMQSAQGGIRDFAHFETIHKLMKALAQKLPGVKSHCTSADISDALGRLTEVVAQNLNQLNAMEVEIRQGQHDAELANPLSTEYEQIMQQVQGGVGSPNQLNSFLAQFTNLQGKIDTVRRQLRTNEGREAIEGLDTAVKARLSEINSIQSNMRTQEADRNTVEPLIREFNNTMEALTRNKISNQYELEQARRNFRDMKERAESARWRVNSQEAKNALSQLAATIANILNQLDR